MSRQSASSVLIRFLATLGRCARGTYEHWNQIHGSLLAASVSFYACFCVFPMILILLAGFGFFLQNTAWGQSYEQSFLRYLADQTSDELAGQVQDLLHQVEAASIVSGPMGIAFLLMTALTLFVNFERCFSIIWGRADRTTGLISAAVDVVLHRFRGFMMLLTIAILILFNFVSYFVIEFVAKWLGDFNHAQKWWQLVHVVSSLGMNALLFSMIYRTLPRTPIRWRYAAQGGLLAALTWELGRYVLAWLIISDKYHAFGVVGVFMGLMMWAYYGTYVVLLGATVTRVNLQLAEEDRLQKRRENRGEADEEAEYLLAFQSRPTYTRSIPLDGDIWEPVPSAKRSTRAA